MGFSFMLFGRRASGKDTVAEMLERKLDVKRLALSKYVHNACHAFGIDNPTKSDLVFIGTEIGRKQVNKSVWIDMGIKEVLNNPDKNYVISDVRFPDEYKAFLDMEFFPILVDCTFERCVERAIKRDGDVDMSLFSHESETNFKKFNGYIIDNNGTIEELERQIDMLLTILDSEETLLNFIEMFEGSYHE